MTEFQIRNSKNSRWRCKVQNILLALAHPLDILVQSGQLARLSPIRLKPEHRANVLPLLLLLRLGDALLEVQVEVVIELLELGLVQARLLVELANNSLGENGAQLSDQVAVLQELAGEVEGNVLAVDHALHEAQPARQNLVRLGKDQHLFAVQGDAHVAVLAYVTGTYK